MAPTGSISCSRAKAKISGRMSKLTTPRSTPAVKLRTKCSRSRNFNASNPPTKVEKKVASDSKTAFMGPRSRRSTLVGRPLLIIYLISRNDSACGKRMRFSAELQNDEPRRSGEDYVAPRGPRQARWYRQHSLHLGCGT